MVCPIAMPKIHTSLKGQLLLDGGKLRGSYFDRTVVLICEHTAEGAFGLVLNRPSESLLEDILPGKLPGMLGTQPLFGGGPVQPEAMSYLILDPLKPGGTVMEHLSVGHSLEQLMEHGEAWMKLGKLRVFAGYAGWSAGQLDDEMRREAWLVEPANVDLIFLDPPERLWHHILRGRTDWRERLLADAPEDPSFN